MDFSAVAFVEVLSYELLCCSLLEASLRVVAHQAMAGSE